MVYAHGIESAFMKLYYLVQFFINAVEREYWKLKGVYYSILDVFFQLHVQKNALYSGTL